MKRYSAFIICLILSATSLGMNTSTDLDVLMDEVVSFSEKIRLSDKDLPQIEHQLKNILAMESLDPSRSGSIYLIPSYTKNKSLYLQAFKKFNLKEQAVLKEIFNNLERLSKTGNG